MQNKITLTEDECTHSFVMAEEIRMVKTFVILQNTTKYYKIE
jgi:hypothetical protein